MDGRISVGGVLFYWDELARHTGGKVCIHFPKYRCRPAIPASTTKGELIGIARPAPVDALLDPAGAVDAAWRKRVARDAIATKTGTVTAGAAPVRDGRREAIRAITRSTGGRRGPRDPQ